MTQEIDSIFPKNNRKENESWISVADMMSGLMMVFLFISIIYIENLGTYIDDINNSQEKICSELLDEFSEVQQEWMLSICEDGLVVKFQNDSIFPQGDDQLTDEFKEILQSFYPRFMDIIWDNQSDISELRIEGHTSSEGGSTMDQFDAYIYNTRLSQNRSRSVMTYVLNLTSIRSNESFLNWSYKNLTAHGLSSSNLILTDNLIENPVRSRRVEFRLKTSAENRLIDLVRDLNETQ